MTRLACLGLMIGLVMAGGCASNQPNWVVEEPVAVCGEGIESECLSVLINQHVIPQYDLGQDLQLKLLALDAAGTIKLNETLTQQWISLSPDSNEAATGFIAAGKAIRTMAEGESSLALEMAISIDHQPASDFAILSIVSKNNGQLDKRQLGLALSTLSKRNPESYHLALQTRLFGLLAIGDLERAKALRLHLLANAPSKGAHFDLVVEIAAAYALSGLQGDAQVIAMDAFQSSPGLATKDNQQLIGIALSVSSGSYPPEQDFYVFSDDAKRLDAYMLVSNLSRRNGNQSYALRALNDSMKLMQKSGFSGSRPDAVIDAALMAAGLI